MLSSGDSTRDKVNVHTSRGMRRRDSEWCLVCRAFWHAMLRWSKLANLSVWVEFQRIEKWMARTLSVDRKKWKKARHLEWNKSSMKHRGCQWRGTFWTQKVCPLFCADKFRFGEPEFVFTTSESQKFRTRKPLGVDKHRRGSVVRHSNNNSHDY